VRRGGALRSLLGQLPKGSKTRPGLRSIGAECNHVRVWWASFSHARYPGRAPAPFALRREPVYVPCQARGAHTEHQGPGGMRWR
jgi:hypothetical protein